MTDDQTLTTNDYMRLAEYEPFRQDSRCKWSNETFADLYWEDDPDFRPLAENWLNRQLVIANEMVQLHEAHDGAMGVLLDYVVSKRHEPIAQATLTTYRTQVDEIRGLVRKVCRSADPYRRATASVYNYRRIHGHWPSDQRALERQFAKDWNLSAAEANDWAWRCASDLWQWRFGAIRTPGAPHHLFVLPDFITRYTLQDVYDLKHGRLAS